jgi:hypothetical protein
MASPGYVVRGKGSPESLTSASHGAGRVMSRTKAMQSFTWSATRKLLAERGVELLSAGLDEVPGVYKDIHAVMAAQTDLVEARARANPKSEYRNSKQIRISGTGKVKKTRMRHGPDLAPSAAASLGRVEVLD